MKRKQIKQILDNNLVISQRRDGSEYIYGKIAVINEICNKLDVRHKLDGRPTPKEVNPYDGKAYKRTKRIIKNH